MSSVKNSLTTSVYKHLKDQTFLPGKSGFEFFPPYAKFLLDKKLEEFSTVQLKLSRAVNLPLLKYFENFSEEELLKIGMQTTAEFLRCCSENKIDEYIQTSTEKWLSNQLPFITKNQINSEDITLFSFIRRTLFRQFITAYTSDLELAMKVLNEIDLFTLKADSNSFKILLNTQHEMYHQAQSLAHIGNWQWNLTTKKLTWSDEVYNIYELAPQSSFTSGDIAAYNHPDDADLINKYMQFSTETMLPHDFYYRIILKNGRQKILHARGEVKQTPGGLPVEMFGTLQDVTDQKQREKELDDSRKFIEKIANISPCIITVYNLNSGKYIFLNKAVEVLTGYSIEDFIEKGRSFFYKQTHADDIRHVKEKTYELVNEPNSIKEFRYRLKHRDGTFRWIHTFTTVFTKDANNAVEEVLNISVDVTESHLLTLQLAAMNEEIKRKERDHQRMINEIEDYAILMINKEGIVQNWNKGAEKIKGYTANEIIGKNFRIFYRKEDQENKLPESLIEEATINGKARHNGWRVRKDGTAFWGNVLITALHDDNQNVIGFSKITRNLTERKLAEDKLRDYANRIEKHNEELQRINSDLDSFTYMASHDLQEPLRKIRTFCNLILDREKENFSKESTLYFERITAATSRMQMLIESLLYYSRATSAEIVLEPVNLNDIVEEVKKELAETIVDTKATIICDELPVVKIMPLQFQQLFLNLISNAIKYACTNVPPVIKISSEFIQPEKKLKPFYTISISDNGIGFEQQYADNIFKLFQRLHGRSEYAGTGVGLAICKKIVENYKGTITATSEPGKGATFIITIPAD